MAASGPQVRQNRGKIRKSEIRVVGQERRYRGTKSEAEHEEINPQGPTSSVPPMKTKKE